MKLKAYFLILYLCNIAAVENKQNYTISSFNYEKDMPQIESLLKAEWNKLFWIPGYDQALITKIFKLRKPGDLTQQDKTLQIKVLHQNQNLVGFVTYYYADKNTGHIELLAIDSQYQSKGYGKILVNTIMQECIWQGAKALQLYVYTHNASAISFYEHLGFHIKKQYPSYLLLVKPLTKDCIL